MFIRQGDVPLTIAPISGELKKKDRVNGRAVLAYGERTGHHHSTIDSHADVFLDSQGREVFVVNEGAFTTIVPERTEIMKVPQFQDKPVNVYRVHTKDGTIVRVNKDRFNEAQHAIKNATTLVWPGALVTHQEHDAIVMPPTLPGTAYTNFGQRSYVSADMAPIRVAD